MQINLCSIVLFARLKDKSNLDGGADLSGEVYH